jgi:hypothetical protein
MKDNKKPSKMKNNKKEIIKDENNKKKPSGTKNNKKETIRDEKQ